MGGFMGGTLGIMGAQEFARGRIADVGNRALDRELPLLPALRVEVTAGPHAESVFQLSNHDA